MSDRLSALLQRFELRAQLFTGGLLHHERPIEPHGSDGHLHVLGRGPLRLLGPKRHRHLLNQPSLVYVPGPLPHRLMAPSAEGAELVTAAIHFGAPDENPLLSSLPPVLCVPMVQLPGLALTQQVLFAEAAAGRCGHAAVVERLVEVLMIQLLRHAMATRLVDAGLMAGLGDARLAKALSAMHADPSRGWTLETLAAVAGMSRARFAAHFAGTVGVPPGDYLTGWRLGLARRLLRRGLAVKQVAAEVGYASPGAFGRVFLQRVGRTPRDWQRAAASSAMAQGVSQW
ncbi:AraC family transcriptional regulator [Rubrivivax rivuli]|uniref:AraC family transcriptional regulator n=1 Tax=Rubrivivax rivuli TaxID=1862385 RepID=A0A437RRX5_9BURK|nr:AraC family transcriptional regulator [Rubrivivax rivuli]RVU49382.1 AraC family transcriptional regulator [Rubrivivax rivuli]